MTSIPPPTSLPLALAAVLCALAMHAAAQSAPAATEELLAQQADACPLDVHGSRPVEFGGKGWIVHAPGGDRTYAGIRFPVKVGPAGKRFAVGVRRDAWFMLVDGREIGPYEDVSAPIYSPDGERFAYFAKRAKRWFPVVDGEEQASLTGNFESSWLGDKLAFSPDSRRAAYVGFTGNDKGRLVVDGQTWPECQSWRGDPIRFSSDSQHVAVACRLPGTFSETAVLLDGKEVARFNGVEQYAFRPGGSELAVFGIGRGTADALFVLGLGPGGGVEPGRKFAREAGPGGPHGPRVAGPYFSRDGTHAAYAISDDNQVDIYLDGRSVYYRSGTPSLRSLVFGTDGARLMAMLREGSRTWIVDLRLGPDAAGGWHVVETTESEAVSEGDLVLSPSGQHWAFVASHAALRAADSWQAAVLDGQAGPRYAGICATLFPSWTSEESLVYVATRAGAQYRVTQRSAEP